jgi:hypothetical protein
MWTIAGGIILAFVIIVTGFALLAGALILLKRIGAIRLTLIFSGIVLVATIFYLAYLSL